MLNGITGGGIGTSKKANYQIGSKKFKTSLD